MNHRNHRGPQRRLLVLSLALASALAAQPAARAEINIGESLEWLTARADRIVVGKVTKVQPERPGALGKNRNLVLFTLQASETLKGAAPQPAYCVAVRDLPAEVLEDHRRRGTELLLFLGATIQATSFDGRVCDLWPLRGEGDSRPWIVPLDDPRERILHAATFQVLTGRDAILSACRDTLRRLAAAPRRPDAPTPRRHLLQVPFDSAAHRVLYAGSTCYLYVPDVLFPKSRPGFH